MEKVGRRVAVRDRLPRGQIRVYPVAERATRRIFSSSFSIASSSPFLFVLPSRVLESEETEETLGALVESSIEI